MNCSHCSRVTSPVKISGQDYCSVCGELYGSVPVELTPAASATARRRAMDISPRTSGQAPHIKSATVLHDRLKTANGARVIDLRKSKSMSDKIPLGVVIQTPHHAIPPIPKAAIRDHRKNSLTVRINQAREYERSPHINKFANKIDRPAHKIKSEDADPKLASVIEKQILAPGVPNIELPKLAATHHEAMTKLAQPAPAASRHDEPNIKQSGRRNLQLSPPGKRVAATMAAIAIMAGYIWVHNYPKMALQSASDKAGLTASMPAYMPSSYNLKQTDTAPGLVTLSFSSPSITEPLKIAQHRTNWDSNSLLDNFVAKQADDYATVQGQGLTIYLYNNNEATWVNRGIRYSIEGASRLSREQILKIAYSL